MQIPCEDSGQPRASLASSDRNFDAETEHLIRVHTDSQVHECDFPWNALSLVNHWLLAGTSFYVVLVRLGIAYLQ